MTDQPLRWGLLSTADINHALIEPLRESKRNRLVAVASRTREKAEAYAHEFDIPRAHGTYEALIADPDVDVIYNPLPNHMHTEWTIKAVQAGKHVLVEKPIALRPEDVDAMQAAAQKHGRIVAEAFMYRHHPQTLKAREIVAGGGLGPIQLIQAGLTTQLGRPGNYRYDPAMGGGGVWDLGCYPVSYARLLLGVEPLEVFGWQVTSDSGIDDVFAGQLRFPGEVFAQFDCSFRAPYRGHVDVIGGDAIMHIARPFHPGADETADQIQIQRSEGIEAVAIPAAGMYIGEVEDMAEAVLDGKPQRVSLADSRGNVAALCALLESARSGKPVKI
jgi:predicted dehydrogenase